MENQSKGVGVTGIMTTVFIALKLAKVIDWSWWLVLSPSLIGIGIGIILFAIIGIDTFLKSTK